MSTLIKDFSIFEDVKNICEVCANIYGILKYIYEATMNKKSQNHESLPD